MDKSSSADEGPTELLGVMTTVGTVVEGLTWLVVEKTAISTGSNASTSSLARSFSC